MARTIHTVFSDAVSPEHEAEFARWYAEVHVPDVCAIPGIVSARRFRLAHQKSAFDGDVAGGNRYLVVYEIDGDPAEVERELTARMADGRLRPTDTMRTDPPPVAVYYEEL
jgi:hypothetical protein